MDKICNQKELAKLLREIKKSEVKTYSGVYVQLMEESSKRDTFSRRRKDNE